MRAAVVVVGVGLMIVPGCGRICTDGHYSEVTHAPAGVISTGWRAVVAARQMSPEHDGERYVIRTVHEDGSQAEHTALLPSMGTTALDGALDGALGYYSSVWWPRAECSSAVTPRALEVIVDDISGRIGVVEIARDAIGHAVTFDESVFQVLWVDAGGVLRQRAIDENGDLGAERSLGRVAIDGATCMAVHALSPHQLFVRVTDHEGRGHVLFVDGTIPAVDRLWTPPPGWQFAQPTAQLVFAGELHVKGVSSAGVTEVAVIPAFSGQVRMLQLGEASDFVFALAGPHRIHALTTFGLMVELEPSYVVARQLGVAPLAGTIGAPFALLGRDITYIDAVPPDGEAMRPGHIQVTRLRNAGEAIWRIDAFVDSPVVPTRVCRATGTPH
jgi:hypothetical protein